MMGRGVRNESSIFNARVGIYNGFKSVFTHRDPDTGDVWGEDIPTTINGFLERGKWVPENSVQWI